MHVLFSDDMRRDAEALSKLQLQVMNKYQNMRSMSSMNGEEILAVNMASMAFCSAVLVLRLTPREQKQWRDFMVEHFDRAISSV